MGNVTYKSKQTVNIKPNTSFIRGKQYNYIWQLASRNASAYSDSNIIIDDESAVCRKKHNFQRIKYWNKWRKKYRKKYVGKRVSFQYRTHRRFSNTKWKLRKTAKGEENRNARKLETKRKHTTSNLHLRSFCANSNDLFPFCLQIRDSAQGILNICCDLQFAVILMQGDIDLGRDVIQLMNNSISEDRRVVNAIFNTVDSIIFSSPSNIMNDNISEAGPATAAEIDSLSNSFMSLSNCTDKEEGQFDYFCQMGGDSTTVVAENLRKQSLYMKFDPLIAGMSMSDKCVTEAVKSSNSSITLDKSGENLDDTLNVTCTEGNGNVGQLVSVTPMKTPVPMAKLPIATATKFYSKEHSSSPLGMGNGSGGEDGRRSDYDVLLQKLSDTEREMGKLKSMLEMTQENEKRLKLELKERIKSKQQLSMVMEEYEKTISQMVTKREEEKKEHEAIVAKLEKERESAAHHLNNLEHAFNDIHQKYERGKAVNFALKQNEDELKKAFQQYQETVQTVERKYEALKAHTDAQLEQANQELELIASTYEKEQSRLKAMQKKSELQISSLQSALERHARENKELMAISDELIHKLSHSSG